jgi:hypothetical protein
MLRGILANKLLKSFTLHNMGKYKTISGRAIPARFFYEEIQNAN